VHEFSLEGMDRFLIGRSADAHLCLRDPRVSRKHCMIQRIAVGQYQISDLDSSAGTWLGKERVRISSLQDGDLFSVGVERFRFELVDQCGKIIHLPSASEEESRLWNVGDSLDFGRGSHCALSILHVLCPLQLGRVNHAGAHAEFLFNQAVQLGNKKLRRKLLLFGKRLSLPYGEIEVHKDRIHWFPRSPGCSILVENISLHAGEKQLLDRISLRIHPGELVAIVGGSGQGKSTLLRCLAGQFVPDSGDISVDGLPATSSLTAQDTAWLTQDAPLDPYLRLDELLELQGWLHLPKDTPLQAIREGGARVRAQVGLHSASATLAAHLSGGERRRAALACELLSSPRLLLLDEPFAGLDPHSAKRLALWLRQLSWEGRTVVLTTHESPIVEHVDTLIALHQGQLVFKGSPQQAKTQFQLTDTSSILGHLIGHPPPAHHKEPDPLQYGSKTRILPFGKHPIQVPLRSRSAFLPIWKRYWYSLIRDRMHLLAIILQPWIIGGFLALLFREDSSIWVAAFALNMTISWFALSASIREFVKERDALQLELRRGMSPFGLVMAKLSAMITVVLPQSLLCIIVVSLKLGSSLSYYWILPILLSSASAPLAAGFLASVLARTPGQANALLPLLLIPQLMFAGVLVPIDTMHWLGSTLSHTTWTYWSQSSIVSLFLHEKPSTLSLIVPPLLALGFAILSSWVASPTKMKSFLGSSARIMKS